MIGRISTLALLFLGFAAAAHGAVEPNATALFEVFGVPITNSMVTGWAFSVLFVIGVILLVGKAGIVPTKRQAVFESILEALRGVLEPIVGKKAFPFAFPLLVTFFLFILFHNWMGLIPGVGTMGWGHDVDGHFHIARPLIRPFTSDFNSTIALALVSFGAWAIIVLKYAGPRVILFDLFGNKADKNDTPVWLYPVLSLVFLVVGFIEVFSILIRPFTLSVRLFGNVYGGENLLHETILVPAVFYFMELLVGLIQALVFTLLTSVYIGLLCNHGDDHEEGHTAEAHH